MNDATVSVLFVDDDPKAGELLARFCRGTPYRCTVHRDPAAALEQFRPGSADVVITDLRMPGMDGIELLNGIRSRDPEVPVILATAYATVDSAIEALRLGASDFIKKPFDMEELLALVEKTLERTRLKRENRLLRRQLKDERLRYGMVGDSEPMREVLRVIEKIADIRCNVVIEGESGTGKELAARAIHTSGQEAERPFVVIDCGALSDTLLESELFGHEKGAFTGAGYTKRGLFEVASGGTVFLDEIGNISDAMQVKILRAIEGQQITRVGGVAPIQIDVRFVAASNRDLAVLVREGTFRHDLYHRLNVVGIRMPPLRDRVDDLPDLVQHFVEHFAEHFRREVTGFDADSMRRIQSYRWPGNVRELRNLVERSVALADGPVLTMGEFAEHTEGGGEGLDADTPTLAELERRYILQVLDRCGGNRAETAGVLGIDKSTLWRKLQVYQKSAG